MALVALNVGCGPLRLDGEIGVDLHPTEGCDVRGDLLRLPFCDDSADRVRLDHVLEHQPMRMCPAVLLEIRRVLKPGGLLRLGVPDLMATCRLYLESDFTDRPWMLRWFYGSQAHAGEFHQSGWDADTLRSLLESAGYVDVDVQDHDPERPDPAALLALAHKPLKEAA